jgi:hypothetical protein
MDWRLLTVRDIVGIVVSFVIFLAVSYASFMYLSGRVLQPNGFGKGWLCRGYGVGDTVCFRQKPAPVQPGQPVYRNPR